MSNFKVGDKVARLIGKDSGTWLSYCNERNVDTNVVAEVVAISNSDSIQLEGSKAWFYGENFERKINPIPAATGTSLGSCQACLTKDDRYPHDCIKHAGEPEGKSTGSTSTPLSEAFSKAARSISAAHNLVFTAEYSGGSSSYYKVLVKNTTTPYALSYTAECNDIIEALGMNFAEGNAFKALWRRAAMRTLGLAKAGAKADGLYDAEKVEFFGKRLVEQSKAVRDAKA